MNKSPHPSMRGHFVYELYKHMKKDKKIWVITGDLGYKMLDQIRSDFPDRFINTGASEQSMVGIGVGLALAGAKPFIYSISTFLLRRAYETHYLYLHHEKIPVRLVGGGRDKDYSHDGISHWMEEDKKLMNILSNIKACWPEDLNEIPDIVDKVVNQDKPWYINLRR